jgi:hypothetical protein
MLIYIVTNIILTLLYTNVNLPKQHKKWNFQNFNGITSFVNYIIAVLI